MLINFNFAQGCCVARPAINPKPFCMKTKFTLTLVTLALAATAFGQANFRITYDANFSGAACQPLGANKIYIHSGAGITDENSAWNVTIGNWGADDGIGEMTNTGTDTWEIEFNLYDYYGLAEGTDIIYGLGMVFRNEDGTLEGKDDACADIFVRGIEAGDITVENSDGTPFSGATAGFIVSGLNDVLKGVSNISIFPSPATEAAVLTFSTSTNNRYDLILTNATGQQIATQRVLGTQAVIERNGLPAGLYFATLVDDQGGRATRRFVFN
jgi:hypothetical protein